MKKIIWTSSVYVISSVLLFSICFFHDHQQTADEDGVWSGSDTFRKHCEYYKLNGKLWAGKLQEFRCLMARMRENWREKKLKGERHHSYGSALARNSIETYYYSVEKY